MHPALKYILAILAVAGITYGFINEGIGPMLTFKWWLQVVGITILFMIISPRPWLKGQPKRSKK